jgi:hypothetical protein
MRSEVADLKGIDGRVQAAQRGIPHPQRCRRRGQRLCPPRAASEKEASRGTCSKHGHDRETTEPETAVGRLPARREPALAQAVLDLLELAGVFLGPPPCRQRRLPVGLVAGGTRPGQPREEGERLGLEPGGQGHPRGVPGQEALGRAPVVHFLSSPHGLVGAKDADSTVILQRRHTTSAWLRRRCSERAERT